MEEDEAVVAVRTNTYYYGWLVGIEVTTSSGRQFSWGDLNRVKNTEHQYIIDALA